MNTSSSERPWGSRFWKNKTYPSKKIKKELEQRFVFQVLKTIKPETERTPGGERRYIIEIKDEFDICYCRVSSCKQKDNLER
jgi:hypothetical protein